MRYEIVYADPPWSFRVWGKQTPGKRTAENYYLTMPLQDISALPVRDIAAADCVLFLWATMPTLEDALQVIRAWGFTYKTCAFVWVKRTKTSGAYHFGMGYWTRANSELCLVATRGTPRRASAAVSQIIDAPLSRHSEKPAEVRDRIVQLMGDRPRIELFARQQVPGWDALGLEIDGRRLEESLPVCARETSNYIPDPTSLTHKREEVHG